MIIPTGTLDFVTARIIFAPSRIIKNTQDSILMFIDLRDSEYEMPIAASNVINDQIAEEMQFISRNSFGDHE